MAKGKMIVGLLAGAAAGAIAGILLAPDKGSVTRDNLSRKGRDTVDNLKTKASDLIDTVADKYLAGHEGSQGSARRNEGGMERTRSAASSFNSGTPGAPSSSNSFV